MKQGNYIDVIFSEVIGKENAERIIAENTKGSRELEERYIEPHGLEVSDAVTKLCADYLKAGFEIGFKTALAIRKAKSKKGAKRNGQSKTGRASGTAAAKGQDRP